MRRLLIALLLVAAPAWGQVASRDFVSADSDYVDVGVLGTYGSNLDQDTTIALWVKTTQTGEATILGHRDGSPVTESGRYWLRLGQRVTTGSLTQVDGWIIMYLIDWADPYNRVQASPANDPNIEDGSWHHIAITTDLWSATPTVSFYIDGVLDSTTYNDQFQWVTDSNLSAPLSFGAFTAPGPSRSDYFDGEIAYAHIYLGVLSAGEIHQVMHCPGSITDGLVGYWPFTDSTTQYDRSGNGNDGTNSGSAASTDGPPIGGCGPAQTIGVQ